jgi:hypothetical protein
VNRIAASLDFHGTEFANTMSLESTIFRPFRSENAVACYANWWADSHVARRHFACSRVVFRSFRTAASGSEGLVVMLGAANAGSGSSDTMVGAAGLSCRED